MRWLRSRSYVRGTPPWSAPVGNALEPTATKSRPCLHWTAVLWRPSEVAVHPTAIIEAGVTIGRGTAIWDNVHVRHSTRIGDDCIIGEKSYIAYGVRIGDFVKINAFVYICTAVTIERGVM